ncbi:hypothetical protein MtrunA17_Chr4g0025821 [Medicago truncatula]|uniref:Transmembrane protein n=1 Tax=Medicago truncatula TaxID=3880 RepID=A0A396IC76_MEDTR|nr:hypothetical protein MtrunA17_Chr4g0025821 [Medicago truncatula]
MSLNTSLLHFPFHIFDTSHYNFIFHLYYSTIALACVFSSYKLIFNLISYYKLLLLLATTFSICIVIKLYYLRRWISIFFIEVGCTIEKDRGKGHLKLNLRKEFVNLLLSPCRKIFLEVREGLDVLVLNVRVG